MKPRNPQYGKGTTGCICEFEVHYLLEVALSKPDAKGCDGRNVKAVGRLPFAPFCGLWEKLGWEDADQ